MRSFRHHYPTRPVDTAAITLRGVGIHERMKPGTVKRPRGIDTHLFVYFYTEAFNTVGGESAHFPAGSLVIWKPLAPHDFGHRARGWDHTWMLAGGQRIARELRRLRIPCETPLAAPGLAGLMEKAFFEIDQEGLQGRADAALIGNLVQNFLIGLGRLLRGPELTAAIPPEYQLVKAYMEEHFAETLTLGQLARRVHRSVPRFATRFKALFGIPPLDYLIRLRMQRAEFLLHDQGYSIGEIGRAVGYSDLHYFSRLFRHRFGKSPRAMRRG
jgi:AraC family transcriptional regulator of arabinose operon